MVALTRGKHGRDPLYRTRQGWGGGLLAQVRHVAACAVAANITLMFWCRRCTESARSLPDADSQCTQLWSAAAGPRILAAPWPVAQHRLTLPLLRAASLSSRGALGEGCTSHVGDGARPHSGEDTSIRCTGCGLPSRGGGWLVGPRFLRLFLTIQMNLQIASIGSMRHFTHPSLNVDRTHEVGSPCK